MTRAAKIVLGGAGIVVLVFSGLLVRYFLAIGAGLGGAGSTVKSERIDFAGRVIDLEGMPVPGAAVKHQCGPELGTVLTGSSGDFLIKCEGAHVFVRAIEAAGYQIALRSQGAQFGPSGSMRASFRSAQRARRQGNLPLLDEDHQPDTWRRYRPGSPKVYRAIREPEDYEEAGVAWLRTHGGWTYDGRPNHTLVWGETHSGLKHDGRPYCGTLERGHGNQIRDVKEHGDAKCEFMISGTLEGDESHRVFRIAIEANRGLEFIEASDEWLTIPPEFGYVRTLAFETAPTTGEAAVRHYYVHRVSPPAYGRVSFETTFYPDFQRGPVTEFSAAFAVDEAGRRFLPPYDGFVIVPWSLYR